jgi:hypothetical protein
LIAGHQGDSNFMYAKRQTSALLQWQQCLPNRARNLVWLAKHFAVRHA